MALLTITLSETKNQQVLCLKIVGNELAPDLVLIRYSFNLCLRSLSDTNIFSQTKKFFFFLNIFELLENQDNYYI